MAFQKLLLNSGLIFIVAIVFFIGGSSGDDSALSNCTLSDNRLPGYIIPKHYNLKLVLDADEEVQSDSPFLEHLKPERAKHDFFFSGEIDVNIDILRSTQDIYFHVRKSIDISSTKLISSNGTEYSPIGNYDYFDAEIKILRYNELLAGEYTLKMKFKIFSTIDINEINELFKASYKEETGEFSVFATRFQAIGARGVFPCWDDPRFRSTFNISVKHRSKYRILSNMPVKKIDEEEENEMRWTHFETTLPIPTYLVAITLNEFGDSDSINERISISSRPNVRKYIALANDVVEKVTSRLESKWKNMKKIPKMDHVAIPHFWTDGMSNTGLTLYR
ncbi:glutamyl aminopeptidase-like [Temnothorax curvispinosus]|uniref:Glutamyl aminopeptidase-like n=1 Tax=Temnothorax curvispinosus TaxID=300111 RepID=A0A6J1QUY6_9HYME|nr:glutamyl aminopeptidase-like [Temnothorax curvispinosus]